MDSKTFFLLKLDTTAWILHLDKETDVWQVYRLVDWLNDKPPQIEGDEQVLAWIEQTGNNLECGYPTERRK